MAEQLAELNKGDLEVYSTDEKQIGVWIDGKPVYEKMVALTSGPYTGAINDISTGITGATKIIYSMGATKMDNIYGNYWGTIPFTNALDQTQNSGYFFEIKSNNITYLNLRLGQKYYEIYIVVRYIK